MRVTFCLIAALLLGLKSAPEGCCATPQPAWRVEAELAGDGSAWESRLPWAVTEVKNASGGKALCASAADAVAESRGISVRVPAKGGYRIWVRYMRSPRPGSFYLLARDEDGEAVAFGKVDWHSRLPTERPYAVAEAERPNKPEWAWEAVEAVFERPMLASLSVGALIHGGGHARRQVDCVVFTNQSGFDPRGCEPDEIPAAPTAEAAGDSTRSPGLPSHSGAFMGVESAKERFHLGLINNASIYLDYTRIVRLGFNADHGASRGSKRHGVGSMAAIEMFVRGNKALAEQYPAPKGRFVNAEGQSGRTWSLSFPPLQEAMRRALIERLEKWRDRPEVEHWRICPETAGWLDYSEDSQAAFRRWLAARYGRVDRLNEAWGTKVESFGAVAAPKDVQENKAGWLDFREFCGEVFAKAVAAQVPIVERHDPQRRPCVGQNSNLDLLGAYFTAMRPMDWEQYINVALAKQPIVGWDTYCADDYLGCEVDLLQSLAGTRDLINEEWNVHTTDWRIAARSFWTMVGKGVKGIYCFQFQEGTHHDSYPKWALLRGDFSPKNKLAAFADCAHEVHRLERLLIGARRQDAVKPVAMYYSRIDLSMDRPLASTWGEGVDSPHHVYELLRGCGYAVRWITPEQIASGQLAQVGGVVLVNAQHIPRTAAKALAEWVRGGGVVIGDRWPGAFDEHGHQEDVLADVFGVQADQSRGRGKRGKLALQESTQGYGEVTINALDVGERHKSVGEMWQQWDSTHPVATALGPYMLSGFGLERVRCVAGQVIGMTFRGRPGVVVNQFGQGHAMYVAMLLGSLYSGSATRFEWDSTHSGMDAYRLLGSFLDHAGVERAATTDLPPRLAAKLRVEAPLCDERGNTLIGVTSLNDQPLEPFKLTVRCSPASAKALQALVALGGSRRLLEVVCNAVENRVELDMPGLGTHAMVLLLQDSAPVVALDVAGAPRRIAGLCHVKPSSRLRIKATVHNPSPEPLRAGRLELSLPLGWAADAHERPVQATAPWGKRTVEFSVAAPPLCAVRRLRPLLLRFHSEGRTSTPVTELVWWESRSSKGQ